jgi:hypothetical protein
MTQVNPQLLAEARDTQLLDDIINIGERFPQVQLNDFKQYVLPMLANPETKDLNWYLELVGSWYRGLDIYDGETHVFTVPPLLTRVETLDSAVDKGQTANILDRANQQARTQPRVGIEAMRTVLIEKVKFSSDDEKYKAMWREVLTACGVPLADTPSEVKATPVAKSDDYESEDL